jgi:hypothetical protein
LLLNKRNTIKQEIQHKETAEEVKYKKLRFIFGLCDNFGGQCILVKKPFKLNNKSLYPNNIERQNVRLVDNVFHYSTIAALKENCEYTETVSFMETIRKWWDIVNTKNPLKGRY